MLIGLAWNVDMCKQVSCLFVVVFVVSSRLSIMRDLKKLIDTHFVRTLKRRPGMTLLDICTN